MLGGTHLHITCPIDRYSTAIAHMVPGSGLVMASREMTKARKGVEWFLRSQAITDIDVWLQIESELPRGKGMASSTVDISASVHATGSALGIKATPELIAEIALNIEPSDGLMFPGIVLFDHREGTVVERLGDPPPMQFVVFDFGGGIDTVLYGSTDRTRQFSQLEPHFQEAFDMVTAGLSQGDPELIGRGATLSALANQNVLPNAHFDAIRCFAKSVGAAGVNVAHSGTALGVAFIDDELVSQAMEAARNWFPNAEAIYRHRLVGGGALTQTP